MSAVFWMTSDLRDLLRGINAASAATSADNLEYRRGFDAAICAVCLSIGADPREVSIRPTQKELAHERP